MLIRVQVDTKGVPSRPRHAGFSTTGLVQTGKSPRQPRPSFAGEDSLVEVRFAGAGLRHPATGQTWRCGSGERDPRPSRLRARATRQSDPMNAERRLQAGFAQRLGKGSRTPGSRWRTSTSYHLASNQRVEARKGSKSMVCAGNLRPEQRPGNHEGEIQGRRGSPPAPRNPSADLPSGAPARCRPRALVRPRATSP